MNETFILVHIGGGKDLSPNLHSITSGFGACCFAKHQLTDVQLIEMQQQFVNNEMVTDVANDCFVALQLADSGRPVLRNAADRKGS
ncbi:MAG: hypothetical protein PHH11_03570 [Methylomonas sp.]|nr:hypothetical protein [Methylomonas sp.]